MITAQRLKEVLSYDADSGHFRWASSWPGVSKGKIAGSIGGAREYRQIMIDRRAYLAHRLAWLYMTGEWPPIVIDHLDGDKTNNKWDNLRLASVSQNAANKKRSATNTSGFKGVTRASRSEKWMAMIEVNGRSIYLGLFITPEEAHTAYCAAAEKHFGKFARHR